MNSSPMLINAFFQSDTVGKIIVILLIVLSCIAWSVVIRKLVEMRKIKAADADFSHAFTAQKNPLELFALHRSFPGSALEEVYRAACEATRHEFESSADKQNRPVGDRFDLSEEKLTLAQIESIRKVAACTASDQCILLSDQMDVISTSYTVAPMLGLFGTVWGVMVAFVAMGQQGVANLSAVAPGIASALLTTVLGLVVAIPAVFMNNLLIRNYNFVSSQVEDFPEKLAVRLQQSFLYEE